jgi:hypothetical protein
MPTIGYGAAKAGEGSVPQAPQPLTRLNLAKLDFATLSHKGRGEVSVALYLGGSFSKLGIPSGMA